MSAHIAGRPSTRYHYVDPNDSEGGSRRHRVVDRIEMQDGVTNDASYVAERHNAHCKLAVWPFDHVRNCVRAPPSAAAISAPGTPAAAAPTPHAGRRAHASSSRAESSCSRAEPSYSRAEPSYSRAEPSSSRAEPSSSRAESSSSRAESSYSRAESSYSRAEPSSSRAEPSSSRAEPSSSCLSPHIPSCPLASVAPSW